MKKFAEQYKVAFNTDSAFVDHWLQSYGTDPAKAKQVFSELISALQRSARRGQKGFGHKSSRRVACQDRRSSVRNRLLPELLPEGIRSSGAWPVGPRQKRYGQASYPKDERDLLAALPRSRLFTRGRDDRLLFALLR